MTPLVLLFFSLLAVGVAIAVLKRRARERAQAAYMAALDRLRRKPSNVAMRTEALDLGRRFAALCRDQGCPTIFDEVALLNDMNAACGGTAVAPDAQPRKSPEERLRSLQRLLSSGLIDEADFAARKREILNEV